MSTENIAVQTMSHRNTSQASWNRNHEGIARPHGTRRTIPS